MTEIEVRVAALEMVMTKVGALVDDGMLDRAADTIHSSLAGADPDERAVLRGALKLIGLARDRL
jgi:hypothetical protein